MYSVAGTLHAVAFDPGQLAVVGTPVPVLEGVAPIAFGSAHAAVASNGSLVYISGGAEDGGPLTVVSVDRQGRASPLPGLAPDAYRDVRIRRTACVSRSPSATMSGVTISPARR